MEATPAPTPAPGDTVTVTAPEDAPLRGTTWWPRGEVTGTVTKAYKNGNLAIAIHQLRNGSEDGCQTMNLPASWCSLAPAPHLG